MRRTLRRQPISLGLAGLIGGRRLQVNAGPRIAAGGGGERSQCRSIETPYRLWRIPFQRLVVQDAICQESCKGFCPVCGADRNVTDCHCDATEIDPRWSGLRDLRF